MSVHKMRRALSKRGRRMGKNRIRNVVIHVTEHTDRAALAEKVCKFHVAVIERRIHQSNLPPNQRILLLDRIIENCRASERVASDS